MKTECPTDDLLFRWLDQKQVQRENGLTEHIYTCTTCSHAVLAEARIRRDRKRLGGLSGIAAVALLSLGLWHTGYVFSSGPAAAEVAEVAGPLYPTDLPQPIQPDGTLWRADHRMTPDDPTPYPAAEEIMGQRSPRVLAWLRKEGGWGDGPIFLEEGVTEYQMDIAADMPNPETMTEEEFREFTKSWVNNYYPTTVRTLQRAHREHLDYALPQALLWSTSEMDRHWITGWEKPYKGLAREYIESFSPEEVYRVLEAFPIKNLGEKARGIYEANYMQ